MDKSMRINRGIRRRLAPMMNNDRRRIELLNGLLMSMPRAPKRHEEKEGRHGCVGEVQRIPSMSRGFDGFEIDEFRNSQWQSEPSSRSRESGRGRGSSAQTEASVRLKLAKLRETEYQSDHFDSQSREHPEAKSPSLSCDTRQTNLLAQRECAEISGRDRSDLLGSDRSLGLIHAPQDSFAIRAFTLNATIMAARRRQSGAAVALIPVKGVLE
jgi:hypothetical protein